MFVFPQAPPPLPQSPPPFSPTDESPTKEATDNQGAFPGEGPLSPMDTDSLEMHTPGDTSSAATTPDLDPQLLFIKLKEVSLVLGNLCFLALLVVKNYFYYFFVLFQLIYDFVFIYILLDLYPKACLVSITGKYTFLV